MKFYLIVYLFHVLSCIFVIICYGFAIFFCVTPIWICVAKINLIRSQLQNIFDWFFFFISIVWIKDRQKFRQKYRQKYRQKHLNIYWIKKTLKYLTKITTYWCIWKMQQLSVLNSFAIESNCFISYRRWTTASLFSLSCGFAKLLEIIETSAIESIKHSK